MTNIRKAREGDRAAVEALLAEARLPLAGVRDTFRGFLVAETSGAIVGAIGLEDYGEFGLLRSAVVHQRWRGRGLGIDLTQRLLDQAREQQRYALYLLTTTAADFFERFGFQRVTREAVPRAVRESVEFQGACPESATVMELKLSIGRSSSGSYPKP